MPDNKNGFVDPLDDVMNRIASQSNSANIITPQQPPKEDFKETLAKQSNEIHKVETPIPEVNYGDDDLNNEIAREEELRKQERQQRIEEAARIHEENKGEKMAPQHLDMNEIANELGFQAETIAIVGKMAEEVVRRNKLPSGGIPVEDETILDENGNPIPIRLRAMGELVEEYQNQGEIITKKFEDIVLNNWILDDGTPARAYILNRDNPQPIEEKKPETNDVVEETPKDPSININVYNSENTPVTVNIDGNIVDDIKTERVIDVYVKEVSEKELRASKVIENCKIENIIKPYDPGLADVPVTLPVSGYRAVLRPMGWFELVTYVQPTARTAADAILKQWSIIYKHLKWTSIGQFESFEDFLKKTKYVDQEFLMWAILVSTASEKETITIGCGDEECKNTHTMSYNPRSIIQIDEESIPKYYKDADNAAPGEEAISVYQNKAVTHRMFRLPNTKVLVEFDSPSVDEFINVKYARMRAVFDQYYPDENFDKILPQLMEMLNSGKMHDTEFALKIAAAIGISAVSLHENGQDYRYTDWDSIEKVLMEVLDYEDSFLLFTKLFPEYAIFKSPVSFTLEGFKCEKCGRDNTHLPITSIAGQLLFSLSQRYENTKINLTDQLPNS